MKKTAKRNVPEHLEVHLQDMRIQKREFLVDYSGGYPTCLLSCPLCLVLFFRLPLSGLDIDIEPSKVSQPRLLWAVGRGSTALLQVAQLWLVYLLLRGEEIGVHALV